MFVINSRQFPMNYGRTVSPGGITIQPYMAHGLGQILWVIGVPNMEFAVNSVSF